MTTMMTWFNTAAVPNLWTTYAAATGKFVLGASADLEATGGNAGSHNHPTLTYGYDSAAPGNAGYLSDDATTSTNSHTVQYINLRLCYIDSNQLTAPRNIIMFTNGSCPVGWTDVTDSVNRYMLAGATDGSENGDTGGSATSAHKHTFKNTDWGLPDGRVYDSTNTDSGIGEWIKLRACEKN